MTNESNHREILSAALSAHVSEIRLFWRETGLICKWLVPDAEHCLVSSEMIAYIREFSEHAERIVHESVREQWLEKAAPLLDESDCAAPYPIRTLTWILRVIESPHRDDMTTDSWNLYLWSVRFSDLPSRIMRKLNAYLEGQGKHAIIDLDTLVSRFVLALQSSLPQDVEKTREKERMLLIHRFDRLRRFKNLVFYGVPNIGRANISKKLIHAWQSMTGREIGAHCVTVFHHHVGYEDMIERRITTGQPRFLIDDGGDQSTPLVHENHIHDAHYFFEYSSSDIQEGLFLALCRAAAHHPEKDYVFMVDCIDEVGVSEVFGEVAHMLDSFARVPWKPGTNGQPGGWDLEAPGARTNRLSHSGRIFFIPSNVYVLGTANEENIWKNTTDKRLIQSFALERLNAQDENELRFTMLAGRDMASFARLEEYVDHSVSLWKKINDCLIAAGGHRNIIGYGPLFAMCEEVLQSSDVQDANRIVLGTWRYRMMPHLMQKMEQMLQQTHDENVEVHRHILDQIIEVLNQSWLRMSVAIEGVSPNETIEVKYENDYIL